MAKNNPKLDLPVIETAPAPAKEQTKKKNAGNKKNNTGKKRRSVGKFFRDIISELKKVSWASFKKGKDNSGVLGQTGVVLVVTLFFMIVIALVDTGLAQLLKLLLSAATAA